MRLLKSPGHKQIIIGLYLIGLAWLLFVVVKMIQQKQPPKFSTKNILFAIGAALVVIGVIFKIQHYPGSTIMMMSGLSSGLLSFFVGSQTKE